MAGQLSSKPFTHCLSCMHRFQSLRTFNRVSRAYISTAQKKQSDAIVVQLRKDIAGYGREGAYIRIAPGHMRNDFFPAKLARYVVGQELKQLLSSGRTIQRDAEFVIRKGPSEAELEAESHTQAQRESARMKESDMTAGHAIGLLSALSKPTYVFFKPVNESGVESSASTSGGPSIFGSVSIADIVQEIKASVAHNPEAATIKFDEDNVRFIGLEKSSDPTRLKTLGVFEIELTLGDAPALKRRVEVRSEGDGSSAN